MRTKAKVVGITERGVEVNLDGATEFIEGDTVVIAVGLKSEKQLAESLQGKVAAVHSIGDCVQPRRLAEAMEEAFHVARGI